VAPKIQLRGIYDKVSEIRLTGCELSKEGKLEIPGLDEDHLEIDLKLPPFELTVNKEIKLFANIEYINSAAITMIQLPETQV